MPKNPPRSGRVMPIPGALKDRYEGYVALASNGLAGRRPSRGKDYLTKAQLMDEIGQQPTAFGNINRGRNAITIADAMALATSLRCNVEDLVFLDWPARQEIAKRRAEGHRRWKQAKVERLRRAMSAFPLPLSVPESWEALAEALGTSNMRLVIRKPSSQEAGLEVADIIDGAHGRLQNAGKLWKSNKEFAAAKSLEEYAAELKTEAGLHLLWGRYVERTHPDDDHGFIWLRKVLVVKVSRFAGEPDFTVDRSHEPREESFPEHNLNEEDDHGMADYIAWCGNRPFWEELR
ncbi:hypothetical protein HPT29_027615 (plasmid) [Microvirga terrae]|uniref:Helix-turn-helix transcriptional regulator n=1 Tax=Microvirga terrae TaxID=2740529 RepID=A0ABY5S2R7_9HYPH|nr:hypothetical protein [Microvirga terrae]UVF22789.1 hypothetical protein HPT29_027615 [Microvirga terrae]